MFSTISAMAGPVGGIGDFFLSIYVMENFWGRRKIGCRSLGTEYSVLYTVTLPDTFFLLYIWAQEKGPPSRQNLSQRTVHDLQHVLYCAQYITKHPE